MQATETHLNGHVFPRARMVSSGPGGFGLGFEPRNLLGAIWLQFAEAAAAQKLYRRCDFCGIWFEVSPRVAGKSRVYHSNACRVKAYRERQAEAQRRYQAGAAIEDIASALDSEPETVRGWVNADSPGRHS
jgi:hypothetical protein